MDDVGEETLSPQAAFALLGDELRLDILLTLYELTERGERAGGSITYSALQEAVGEPDSGKFNYHLSRLVGQFVEKLEHGYSIRHPGKMVVRAVLSGTFTEDPEFGPVAVDETCFRCGGTVAVSYANEHVFSQCTDCAGSFSLPRYPSQLLSGLTYPPAGLEDRTPSETLELVHLRFEREVELLASGSCPDCGGEAKRELVVCPTHDAAEGELCDSCQFSVGALGELECSVCGCDRVTPPLLAHAHHPVVLDVLLDGRSESTAWERFSRAMTLPYDVSDPDEPAIVYRTPEGDRGVRIGGDLSLTVE